MERPFDKVAVVVVDGVGCGEALDAKSDYPKDVGVNSLLHASQKKPIDALALQLMGLEGVPGLDGMRVEKHIPRIHVQGAYGALEPTFAGNGSPEGHQALMGLIVREPYLLFDQPPGFPPEICALVKKAIEEVTQRTVEIIRYPGTDDISGTIFIEHESIGQVHLTSKDRAKPLYVPIYASSDSIVQIALHQDVVPQGIIEKIGMKVREMLNASEFRVARVIMRPFVDEPGSFRRVDADRRDYVPDPDGPTLIDYLTEADIPVHGIGKAPSLFDNKGFPHHLIQKLKKDPERIQAVLRYFQIVKDPSFAFANLVWTDELYGHRRKPESYITHINTVVDETIARIKATMTDRDVLIVTSDHGNDPTHGGTNHTRERVPLLVFTPRLRRAVYLGVRKTYSDVAKTIGENFGVADRLLEGESFLEDLLAA